MRSLFTSLFGRKPEQLRNQQETLLTKAEREQNKLKDTIATAERILARDAANNLALYSIIGASIRLDQYDNSSNYVQQLLDKGYTQASNWCDYSDSLRRQNASSEAITAIEIALKMAPGDAEVLRVGGYIYSHVGQHDRAIDLMKTLIAKCSPVADDWLSYGYYMSQTAASHDDIIAAYTRALSLESNHILALNNRGYQYGLMGKYREAVEDLDRVIEFDPRHAYAYNNRGFARLKLQMYEKGLADVLRSLELDPQNSYAYRNRGIYYFDMADFKEALADFEKAYQLDPSTPWVEQYLEETREVLSKIA